MGTSALLGHHGFGGMRHLKKEKLAIQIHWWKFARQYSGRMVPIAVEVLRFEGKWCGSRNRI